MIFCARATRGLRKPSLDARSRRPISPHPRRDNERAWKDYLLSLPTRAIEGQLGHPSGIKQKEREKIEYVSGSVRLMP
jgi:hypothetical protein